MILMSSVGLLVHGSGNNSLTDTLTIDKMETERLIALAPIMMLSQTIEAAKKYSDFSAEI